MKLPNGYGSVSKVKGNRRKPYRAYITVGWDGQKQSKKDLGYFQTYEDGISALVEYHGNPFDLDYKNITFEEIWNEERDELVKLVKNKKMSDSNLDSLTLAFKNHCKDLHKEPILKIKYKKMQDIVDSAVNQNNGEPLGYSGKGYIVTVCRKVFTRAINVYELPILKNPTEKLSAGEKPKSEKHKIFTDDQMAILWGMQHNDIIKIFLIMCYGGERPNEIFTAEREKIFLDEDYFVSGSKTEAGRDRDIPIHPKVKHLFKYFYNNGEKYPFKKIFENFNYSKFSRETTKLMKELGFDNTPYDCRHTFITKMKQAGANEYLLKRIVGHSIQDLSESVYTHRDVKELFNEILKIS